MRENAREGRWDGSGKSLGDSSDHSADLIPVEEKEKFSLQCSFKRVSTRVMGGEEGVVLEVTSPIRGNPFLTELGLFHIPAGSFGKHAFCAKMANSECITFCQLSPHHKRTERHTFIAATPHTQKDATKKW